MIGSVFMYPRLNQQIRKHRKVATKRSIRVTESTQTPTPMIRSELMV